MENEEKRKRAKKRVEEIRGFYIHLMVYLVVNAFIVIVIMIQSRMQEEPLLRWPVLVTPFFWGIGLAFHALHVFGYGSWFGKKWERRMIEKFMEEDRREAEKYNKPH